MSIYDDQYNEEPKKQPPGEPPIDQPGSPPPKPVFDSADVVDATAAEDTEPAARRGCGCGSCFLAFLAMGLISVAVCGFGGYLTYQRTPGWIHEGIVSAVNESDLDPAAKRGVTEQLDRLLREYNAGNVTGEQLAESLRELGESPILVLILSYAAMESYVKPSGLSDDEKSAAKLAFQRVARGTVDHTIDPDDLEQALDYISKKDFNGNRQLKQKVSDEDLRKLVEECRRVADAAEVPDEPYQVDVVSEVKRIVDRALGIEPEEELAPEELDDVDSGGEEVGTVSAVRSPQIRPAFEQSEN